MGEHILESMNPARKVLYYSGAEMIKQPDLNLLNGNGEQGIDSREIKGLEWENLVTDGMWEVERN